MAKVNEECFEIKLLLSLLHAVYMLKIAVHPLPVGHTVTAHSIACANQIKFATTTSLYTEDEPKAASCHGVYYNLTHDHLLIILLYNVHTSIYI